MRVRSFHDQQTGIELTIQEVSSQQKLGSYFICGTEIGQFDPFSYLFLSLQTTDL